MVNRVLGAIPLIGDLRTGGDGQGVLGVTYTIKGPIEKPSVSVNPASLLTPGFLRNIFFGGEESDEESYPDDDDTLPATTTGPVRTNINRKR
ncbi:MAG: hypothetical protein AB7H77_03535 [Bdellovibrionales bacterium]